MKQKPLKKQLIEQFYHKNKLFFTIAIIASLLTGSLNLILSWLIQQLIDAASGSSGCFTLKTLTLISIGFIFLCIGSLLLDYISEPRYIEKAIRQYKDFAFQKLTQKGIAVIPRSTKPENIKDNFDLFDFTLTDNEMAQRGVLLQRSCLPTRTVTSPCLPAMQRMCTPTPTALRQSTAMRKILKN